MTKDELIEKAKSLIYNAEAFASFYNETAEDDEDAAFVETWREEQKEWLKEADKLVKEK